MTHRLPLHANRSPFRPLHPDSRASRCYEPSGLITNRCEIDLRQHLSLRPDLILDQIYEVWLFGLVPFLRQAFQRRNITNKWLEGDK
ncbi:hypothetical protein EVAR_73472_1 [Eumeta japonica]|uniref:Uncharacterized protein n=1 Tax=Eumeta variegata TaxID=151549 RepID=A0A4C1T4H5_EUMVA|nr:hypothetical protein EVAR_73472_1 [Eumeta japonica]